MVVVVLLVRRQLYADTRLGKVWFTMHVACQVGGAGGAQRSC